MHAVVVAQAQKAMLMFDVELIVHSTITSRNMSTKAVVVHTMPVAAMLYKLQCETNVLAATGTFEESTEKRNRLYKGS